MCKIKRVLGGLLGAVCHVLPCGAKVNPLPEPLSPQVAEQGSEYYRFQTLYFDSADNQRHYKIWLAIPYRPVPAGGYPVIYLLDGNQALANLSETLLGQLHGADAPVLVAIGYDADQPVILKSRILDYTPPGEDVSQDETRPAWIAFPGGGSQAFRALLFNQLIPWVETQAVSNPYKRAIWGHSFGGLFVLDTLAESSWFHYYFTAAPSLLWQNTRILQQALCADDSQFTGQSVVLMAGDNTLDYPPMLHGEVNEAEATLINLIKEKGADLSIIRYPGQQHGQVFDSSLRDALKKMSQIR